MFGKLEQRCCKTKLLTAPLREEHPGLQDKNLESFKAKEESFKRMKIVSSDAFWKYSSAEAVEASFEIAYSIALAKNLHNIGKTLIKLCMLTAASLVLGEANRKERAKIFLTDPTVKTRNDEITEDIELQVLENINKSCAFALQCDETTDIVEMFQ